MIVFSTFALLGNIRSADWCQFNKTLFQSNVLTQKHGENLILFKSIIEQEVIIEMSKDLKLNWLLISATWEGGQIDMEHPP